VKIRTTPRAQARIRRISAWWEAKRDNAPGLFKEELEEAKARLLVAPKLAQLYARVDEDIVWRILLRGTEQYVYYVVDEKG
jgi:plasmid stabilization system protein ParE